MLTLGIEFSTQSVKAVLLDLKSAQVIHTGKFNYDDRFPEYGTREGVLPHRNSEIRHTSPRLLLEAVDAIFLMLQGSGADLSRIGTVKIDAMQHCTICTDQTFRDRLRNLDPGLSLLEQVEKSLTRATVPIWEDRSTKKEIEFIDQYLEGDGGAARITGNQAELRFPAAQVMKWGRESPPEYRQTAHIQLLSSFLTSLLLGEPAPVDTGDGWGTNWNHIDIEQPGWHPRALTAVDAYLNLGGSDSITGKTGSMTHYDQPLGTIQTYFTKKYGLPKTAIILAGTGDNPATLLGCGGATTISLGSSYTVNGIMEANEPSPTGEYNLFGYTPGRVMGLSVISNGGKVHHLFIRRYILPDPIQEVTPDYWQLYLHKAGTAFLHPDEKLMLPYLFSESVPLRNRGIIRDQMAEGDDIANIRALHISQALSLRLHSRHLRQTDTLCIAAGGAQNNFLRQLIADVFQTPTYAIHHADYAAPLGCAVSGARHLLNLSYEDAARIFVRVDETTRSSPLPENRPVIDTLLTRYRELEERKP